MKIYMKTEGRRIQKATTPCFAKHRKKIVIGNFAVIGLTIIAHLCVNLIPTSGSSSIPTDGSNKVDGKWADWQEWGQCSVTCSNGTRVRNRDCSFPAPSNGGENCSGDNSQTESCLRGIACPVDGKWADWQEWGQCSVTCSNGTRVRNRDCSSPAPSNGGENCSGDNSQTESCYGGIACPVDGKWTDWQEWGQCSVTCSNGTRVRNRACSSPGENCAGDSNQTGHCYGDIDYPDYMFEPFSFFHGKMADWQEWGHCSVTCSNGIRLRYRDCLFPAPAYCGKNCSDYSWQAGHCYGGKACPDNSISQWAQTVINVSSEYGPERWAANQILGPPDVYPEYDGNGNAWSPKCKDKAEFIEIQFAKPVQVTSLDIYETYGGGTIQRIRCYHSQDGQYTDLWTTSKQIERLEVVRKFSPNLNDSCFSKQIRLEIHCNGLFSDIDAVQLHGIASVG